MKPSYSAFKRTVMSYYRRHGRHDLPWRTTTDPYAILVSEIMLQQTQVERVIPFYRAFLKRFPSFASLSRARTTSLLKMWQGLGYNRRALMLRRCAKEVTHNHAGELPSTCEELKALAGIGPYTAGAVMAFAFNKPYPIIETNIRRIYIHHFFAGKEGVDDADIMPIVQGTLNMRNPRAWFSALMDYGSWLAGTIENPNRNSRHYAKQSRFEGSVRQVRGRVLKTFLEHPTMHERSLKKEIDDPRLDEVLRGLEKEGFLKRRNGVLRCP